MHPVLDLHLYMESIDTAIRLLHNGIGSFDCIALAQVIFPVLKIIYIFTLFPFEDLKFPFNSDYHCWNNFHFHSNTISICQIISIPNNFHIHSK